MNPDNLEDPIEPGAPMPDAIPLDVTTDDIGKAAPTMGERLVGNSTEPGVVITELRGARTVDLLLNLPLRLASTPDGGQAFDMHHCMIIEEAVRRQMDATMWAVKALTWKG